MPRRLLILAIGLIPSILLGWTSAAEQRIARKSAALAPPDLRVLLEKYRAEFDRGRVAAASEETLESHRFVVATGQGPLRQQIHTELETTIRMLRTRQPMPSAIERLGRLVHYVADANNPLHVANDYPELERMRGDYAAFFEQKLPKFPTVFYGLTWPVKPGPYVDQTLTRSARLYPLLYSEYFGQGIHQTSADFDDRSTAFGIAAVAYSHAVTDLVNLYYHVWKEAGGDVRTAWGLRKGNLLVGSEPGPFLSGGPLSENATQR